MGVRIDPSGKGDLAVSIAACSAVYYGGKRFLKNKVANEDQWAAHLVNLLHSVTSSCMSWSCSQDIAQGWGSADHARNLNVSKGYKPHPLFTRVLWWELGYYVFDTMLDLIEAKRKGVSLLLVGFQLHHLVPLLASWSLSEWRAQRATRVTDWVTATLMVSNASTAFQHVLWALDRLRYARTSGAYRAVFLLFLTSFVALRQLGLLWVLRKFSQLQDPSRPPSIRHALEMMPLKCKLGTLVLSIINLVWLVMNIRGRFVSAFLKPKVLP